MNTITPLAAALVCGLALTACGGSSSAGNSGSGNTGGGSIAACFSATKTVRFSMTDNTENTQNSQYSGYPIASTVGPATFNNQPAMAQTRFYSPEEKNGDTEYWAITSSGVSLLGTKYDGGTVETPSSPLIIPLDLQPGQSFHFITDENRSRTITLVGFETLTLAGKTFTNVCHFQGNFDDDHDRQPNYFWYAPGYGDIKGDTGVPYGNPTTYYYTGDL